MLTVHYSKTEAASSRPRELVHIESTCCSFVDWTFDATHADLRLVVTGSAEGLAALEIGVRPGAEAPDSGTDLVSSRAHTPGVVSGEASYVRQTRGV